MLRKGCLFDAFNALILMFIAATTVYPVLYMLAVSFSDTASIVQNKIFLWPRGFNIEAYQAIYESGKIPRAYLNTIIYTSLGVFVLLLMTAVAAYPLSRKTFFGRKYFMIAIVLTMFFNGGMIPSYLIVQKLGMINTMWALVIPNAIWTFELLILKNFYEAMSNSLRESALIDGASEYRILFSIIIPLSKPALASIGLFFFMGHWNSFFVPMIYLNDYELYPLQVVLRDMLILNENESKPSKLLTGTVLTPEAVKNAAMFVSIIPVLLIYPFAQKYFAKGIMLGAEKG